MNQTVENYLKGLYALGESFPKGVSTNALAERLDTKASSITDMLKKLHEKGLVKHAPYHGALLTAKGRKIALAVVRKHRLWEVFLVEKLGFGWDEVHDIAEQLEHVHSDELVEKLDAFLGFPRRDPHGDPIPDADGQFAPDDLVSLDAVAVGSRLVIRGVRDHSTSFLQHIGRIGLMPGQKVLLSEVMGYDASCHLILLPSKEKISISAATAKNLLVQVP